MPQNPFGVAAPLIVLLLTGGPAVSDSYAAAPQPAERRTAQTAQTAPEQTASRGPRAMDAQATREDLLEILQKHPPSVARVMKLDPSLIRNESYLASYPTLRAFLADHPEIAQNVPYYLEQVRVFDGDWQPRNPRIQLVQGTLAGVAGFTAFAIVLGTLIWLIRTVLEQRRWSRLSKIQAEVHSKLMDRFSSNDELLTYVQTPSGRRFLESGPSPLVEAPPTISAPFTRILWSVQLGVVLLVGGLGMLFVSTRTFEEVQEFFFISGCLSLALGSGFVVSAAASYGLSRKLGLLDRPAADHA
jgi:hypothetical protein